MDIPIVYFSLLYIFIKEKQTKKLPILSGVSVSLLFKVTYLALAASISD